MDVAFSIPLFSPKPSVHVHLSSSGLQDEKTSDRKMKVPVSALAQKPCVQVNTRSKGWFWSAAVSSHSPSAFSAGVALVPSSDWQEDSVPRL